MEWRNSMKLGLSVIPRMLNPDTAKPFELQQIAEYGGLDAMLASWKKQGVSHIEFRCIHPGDDAAYALACAERVWAAGLQVTVHGTLPSAVGRFETVYPSLLPLLSAAKAYQPWVNITVHAYSSNEAADLAKLAANTNEILSLWAEDAQSLGFRLALENNRSKGECDPGNHCDGVLSMLPPSELVGVCFDFGHHYYNMSINDGTPDQLPPPEFLQRAFHTHIHALSNKKTHAPFVGDAVMPLARYLAALQSAGYTGVYNLELSVNLFEVASYREAIDTSIRVLREALRTENR